MTPLMAEIAQAVESAGALVNNNQLVEDLRSALAYGQNAAECVPDILGEVIETQAWVSRLDSRVGLIKFSHDQFEKFLTDPAPRGLETTKDAIRKYLGDSTNPLRIEFEKWAEGKPGPPPGNKNGPNGRAGAQAKEPIPNTVRFWFPGDEVPSNPSPQPEPPSPPVRDRSHEPQAGNSVGYAVRRLERMIEADPHGPAAAAYDRLKAGEISANAAAVLAGFRPRSITIPDDPIKAVPVLAKHFRGERRATLLAAWDRLVGESEA